MGMHTTKVAVGEGKFALEAQLTVTPRGMAVYTWAPRHRPFRVPSPAVRRR